MQSDRELLRRIVRQDTDAFDVLLDRHQREIRARALRIVRDATLAEDVVQEVFLRLWTRAEQFGGQGSVRSWLNRIATNLALNQLRSRRRRRSRPLEAPPVGATDFDADDAPDPAWMADASAPRPDAVADLAERRQRLTELIGRLPEEKRRIYDMVQNEHMDIRSAAAELGIPEGTAKSRLHYARKTLAQAWRELEDEWENE